MKKFSIVIIIISCFLVGWGTYCLGKLCLAKAYYNKGVALAKSDSYEESINFYAKAIKLEPRYTEAWCSKAVVLLRIGRSNEALEAIEKATELEPNYPFVWNSKGWLLERLGRTEEADEAYKKMRACKNVSSTNNKFRRILTPPIFSRRTK